MVSEANKAERCVGAQTVIRNVLSQTCNAEPKAPLYTQKWWWQGSGTYGERVEREPITGVWGQSPQRGAGAEPLVRSPLKLKSFGKTTSKSAHKFSTERKSVWLKNFRLHVKKWWWLSPLIKVVVTCHHRHIQSCAYVQNWGIATLCLRMPHLYFCSHIHMRTCYAF